MACNTNVWGATIKYGPVVTITAAIPYHPPWPGHFSEQSAKRLAQRHQQTIQNANFPKHEWFECDPDCKKSTYERPILLPEEQEEISGWENMVYYDHVDGSVTFLYEWTCTNTKATLIYGACRDFVVNIEELLKAIPENLAKKIRECET